MYPPMPYSKLYNEEAGMKYENYFNIRANLLLVPDLPYWIFPPLEDGVFLLQIFTFPSKHPKQK